MQLVDVRNWISLNKFRIEILFELEIIIDIIDEIILTVS